MRFRFPQHVFQCESPARCSDERAARGDDGAVAAGHPRLVPEQALQAQQEDQRAEDSDGAGEGEKGWDGKTWWKCKNRKLIIIIRKWSRSATGECTAYLWSRPAQSGTTSRQLTYTASKLHRFNRRGKWFPISPCTPTRRIMGCTTECTRQHIKTLWIR